MKRLRLAILSASLLLLTVVSALSGEAATSTGGASGAGPITAKDFSRQKFDRSTRIDNTWFPMRPGTQFVYRGATSEGGKRVPHRVVFTVTDLIKTIHGVRTVVIWDRDYSAGELVEEEVAFFAQDNDGNIWHLGQYPEEYEDGKFVQAPAWIAGLKGARAGIAMLAEPRLGLPSYSEGYAPPPINWTDRARVYKRGIRNCVPAGCFKGVLVTDEFNPDQPGKHQLKYYAPGVGNIRVGWMGKNETDKEVLVLVDVVRLGPKALANVRAAALKLEQRAYKTKKDVYGRTPPAERLR